MVLARRFADTMARACDALALATARDQALRR